MTHQPDYKEILPVPGYLKRDYKYPRLPLEQVGHKTLLDALLVNKGSTYVHDAILKGAMYYMDFHGVRPPLHDPALSKNLKELVAKADDPGKEDVGPGDILWMSYETTVLTKPMFEAIESGTARIYFVAHAEWTTKGVPDHLDTCSWLQPISWGDREGMPQLDPTKTNPVWHSC